MRNGKYYIGSTDDVDRRYRDHQNGNTPSTKIHRPLKLIACKQCESLTDARKIEKYIKSCKSRKIIEEFVKENPR
jgi:putative endonuclease